MIFREYPTLKKLLNGETVEVDGFRVQMVGHGYEIKPGDLYVGERNTAPRLLVAKRVSENPSPPGQGYITPVEMAYSYNIRECIKVCEAP